MQLNRHKLPLLPGAPKKPQDNSARSTFNHEGNQVFAFLAIQAYQSESRTKGSMDHRSACGATRSRSQLGQSNDLW